MARNTHLSESPVTVGSSCLLNLGINLYCLDCSHRASWPPAELATIEPPWRSVWDFKRRRYCSKCGARGSSERVFLNCFVVGTGSGDRQLNPTAPQLWAG